jgi:hypothetical protein
MAVEGARSDTALQPAHVQVLNPAEGCDQTLSARVQQVFQIHLWDGGVPTDTVYVIAQIKTLQGPNPAS